MAYIQQKQRYQLSLEKDLTSLHKNSNDGFYLLGKKIAELYKDRETEKNQLNVELAEFLQSMSLEKNRKEIDARLQQGETLREIMKISDFCMNALFETAKVFVRENQWKESLSCFLALASLDSHSYPILLLLGNSFFNLKRYEEALQTYFLATPYARDFALCFSTIVCLGKLGRYKEAKTLAEESLKLVKELPTPDQETIEILETLSKQYTEVGDKL